MIQFEVDYELIANKQVLIANKPAYYVITINQYFLA